MDERKWMNMDVMRVDEYGWAKKCTDERIKLLDILLSW